jgi:pimeloyl-ACP methyl ester carboxylesterase
MLKKTKAGVLNVAYLESGPSDGTPVLLLHGFPYDVHSYDQATPLLVSAGCRVLTPYLRGYGPHTFCPKTL